MGSSDRQRSEFETIYPVVLFVYFFVVLSLTMFVMHPVFLIISFFSSLTYLIFLKGTKALFAALTSVTVILFSACFNVLFNHEGVTILFYFFDNPITLESFIYGIFSGIMFSCVILWFSIFNVIITSEKIIFVTGRILPSVSLTFTLALRFVPRFAREIKEIYNSQRAINGDFKDASGAKQKIKSGVAVLSTMVSWALENSIETADSMKSRGFGLKKRTFFSRFKFEFFDKLCLCVIFIIALIIFLSLANNMVFINFFPYFKFGHKAYLGIITFLSYGVICFLPIIIDLLGVFKWKYLK